jgi:hypothetical protein
MFTNSGGCNGVDHPDEMAFTSGFNDTNEIKLSSRRHNNVNKSKKHKSKKKYKEMLRNKDLQIKELNEYLFRAKEDITCL